MKVSTGLFALLLCAVMLFSSLRTVSGARDMRFTGVKKEVIITLQ